MRQEPVAAQQGARVWGFMYALGVDGLPPQVSINGEPYRLERAVKHDFWAATGFYTHCALGQRVVLKFGRSRRLGPLPMRWSGRWGVGRESRFYQRLADVAAVPRWLGRIDPPWIGFGHEYIVGQPMSEVSPARLDAPLFAALSAALAELHKRGIAYVDLHKRQNVIIDDEGRPHLIDFQISYDMHSGLKRWLVLPVIRRWLLAMAVRSDNYHVLKHKRRKRPDLLTDSERQSSQRSGFIRVHRLLITPYLAVRRRLLKRWRGSGRLMPEGRR